MIRRLYYWLNNLILRLKNEVGYRRGLVSKVEHSLKRKFLRVPEQFGGDYFYQSYPPLKIRGERPSGARFTLYRLAGRLTASTKILDVGGNVGFFSMFIAPRVARIDIVELNPELRAVGQSLKEIERIDNVQYVGDDIRTLDTAERYDLIFSFAVHKWVGIPFPEYIRLLRGFLAPGGVILIESQDLAQDDLPTRVAELDEEFEILEQGETDDHMGLARSFFYLRPR